MTASSEAWIFDDSLTERARAVLYPRVFGLVDSAHRSSDVDRVTVRFKSIVRMRDLTTFAYRVRAVVVLIFVLVVGVHTVMQQVL